MACESPACRAVERSLALAVRMFCESRLKAFAAPIIAVSRRAPAATARREAAERAAAAMDSTYAAAFILLKFLYLPPGFSGYRGRDSSLFKTIIDWRNRFIASADIQVRGELYRNLARQPAAYRFEVIVRQGDVGLDFVNLEFFKVYGISGNRYLPGPCLIRFGLKFVFCSMSPLSARTWASEFQPPP